MLQTQAVSPQLLELLRELMRMEAFKPFVLVGGTSLALRMGHRLSIDLDLFGRQELDEHEFSELLGTLGSVVLLKKSRKILVYSINGIKVDFVDYVYPWVAPTSVVEDVRLASKMDIAAMKLNAIAGRGSKKDFVDLYFLLNEYSLSDMFGFYNEKYRQNSLLMVLKSLTYFDDADEEEDPIMLTAVKWETIKKHISGEVKKHITTM